MTHNYKLRKQEKGACFPVIIGSMSFCYHIANNIFESNLSYSLGTNRANLFDESRTAHVNSNILVICKHDIQCGNIMMLMICMCVGHARFLLEKKTNYYMGLSRDKRELLHNKLKNDKQIGDFEVSLEFLEYVL